MKQLFEFVESFRCRQGGWELTADQVLIEQAVKPKLRKRGGETGILGTGENDSFHRLGLTIGGGADGGERDRFLAPIPGQPQRREQNHGAEREGTIQSLHIILRPF